MVRQLTDCIADRFAACSKRTVSVNRNFFDILATMHIVIINIPGRMSLRCFRFFRFAHRLRSLHNWLRQIE